MNNTTALYEDFKLRIKALSHGILPPLISGKYLDNFAAPGFGAGPQGKTFYFSTTENRNISKMISVPVFAPEHHLHSYALKTELGEEPGTIVADNSIILKSCILSKFLSLKLNHRLLSKEGIIMKHCYNTCTSVLGFSCKHFDTGEECTYCETTSIGEKVLGFPKVQSIDNFVEAVKIAVTNDSVRSLTITSGTFDNPDEVLKYYIKLLTILKKEVNISIHIQHEPVNDVSLIKEASQLADSVGILLEICDDKIRKEICPGKSKIDKSHYIKNWEAAVKYYRKGNVGTTCLLGFGEDYDEIIKEIERFAQIGVKTSLLFIRCNSKKLIGFIPSYLLVDEKEIIDLYINTAKVLKKFDLGYNLGKGSGCLGCQGCTAMVEACELVDTL